MKSVYFSGEMDFVSFLENKGLTEKYVKDILRYCNKIFENNIITSSDLIKFYKELKQSKKYYFLAIRNLISFWEEEDLIPEKDINLLKNKIKRQSENHIDSYVPKKEEIDLLLNKTKSKKEYNIAVKILIESGLRISNFQTFLDTFDRSKVEFRNGIVSYPLFDIKGKKGSFYLFMSENTYDEFLSSYDSFKHFNIQFLKTFLRYHKLICLKYVRKYHFTKMIENGIDFEIANFIQGRASKNIGFNHYLAKKEIALKEYQKVVMT